MSGPGATPELFTVSPNQAEAPGIPRDYWGRPKVVPIGGGNRVAYTRTTTFVGSVEDTYNLSAWSQRLALRGVAIHDDIIAAVRDTDPLNKARLDELVAEAKLRVGGSDGATAGTYMHKVTEAADRGQDPGMVDAPLLSTGQVEPSAHVADLAAYLQATEPLKHLAIEAFLVQDPLKVAGTTDRIVQYQGKRYIADLKTAQDISWGGITMAAQLAMYARSRPYDVTTDQRGDPHGCEIDRGIIIHLPFGSAECHLYWIDLLAGWEAVITARDVREARKKKWAHLARELHHVPPGPISLGAQITSCVTPEEVRALWLAHREQWTEDLTELSKAHIASLESIPAP